LDDEGKTQPSVLQECHASICELMQEMKLTSIAIPSISTGFYGFPKKEAAEIACGYMVKWLNGAQQKQVTTQ